MILRGLALPPLQTNFLAKKLQIRGAPCPSQATLTVRILRYELEKRLRSVYPVPLYTPIPGVTDFEPEDLGCLGTKVLG